MTSAATNPNSIQSTIISGINWLGEMAEVPLKVLDYSVRSSPRIIVPIALGAIGGWLSGVSWQMGALQGGTTGLLYSYVFYPIGDWIAKNRGEGPGQINFKGNAVLRVAGTILDFAGPWLFTSYCGASLLNKVGSNVGALSFLMPVADAAEKYNVWRSILVNTSPIIAQFLLEGLLEADKAVKRNH